MMDKKPGAFEHIPDREHLTRPNPVRFRVGLFTKLIFAFTIVVLTVGVLVTWLVGRATQQELHLYSSEMNSRQANRLAPVLGVMYKETGNWEDLQGFFFFSDPSVKRHSSEGGMRPGMSISDGHMMGQEMSSRMQVWDVIGPRILIADTEGEIVADSSGELLGKTIGDESLLAGAPVLVDDERVGTVLVATGEISSSMNDEFLDRVKNATLLAALVAGGLALLLGVFITWGVTRPVQKLTRAAEALAGGDFSYRVDVQSGDEMGDLAISFNQMAAELERAESLRRQMTADIAHELRTPLSVIQGNIEALQDGIFELTPEALEPIHAKTHLLNRLVDDLRELALAETGRLALDRQPTDLSVLVARAVNSFRPAAEAKLIALSVDSVSEIPLIDVDPQRIDQVMVNILSNALRHTPKGGRIDVKLTVENANRLSIAIRDSGAGIPPDALPYIFERFYRVDKGRARTNDREGSGLGLAVARSIVEMHGGEISVASPPGRGAIFTFSFPIVR